MPAGFDFYETTYCEMNDHDRTGFLPPIEQHQLPSSSTQLIPSDVTPAPLTGRGDGSARYSAGRTRTISACRGDKARLHWQFDRDQSEGSTANESITSIPRIEPKGLVKQLHKIPRNIIEQLSNNYQWTSTTSKAAEEACLRVPEIEPPHTTLERNADMVKFRPLRYASQPDIWQIVAPAWDKVQKRPVGSNFGPIDGTRQTRRSKIDRATRSQITVSETVRDLVKRNKLSSTYIRQCPGYAGFVPRSPTQNAMEFRTGNKGTHSHSTTMRSSYKLLPAKEYTVANKFHHHGPLSKTVTLTYPFNPFNKIDQELNNRTVVKEPTT